MKMHHSIRVASAVCAWAIIGSTGSAQSTVDQLATRLANQRVILMAALDLKLVTRYASPIADQPIEFLVGRSAFTDSPEVFRRRIDQLRSTLSGYQKMFRDAPALTRYVGDILKSAQERQNDDQSRTYESEAGWNDALDAKMVGQIVAASSSLGEALSLRNLLRDGVKQALLDRSEVRLALAGQKPVPPALEKSRARLMSLITQASKGR